MDARDSIDHPQHQAHGPDRTSAPPAVRWYRRPWGVAVLAAAVLLVVGGVAAAVALAGGDDGADPVVASPSSPATQTPTPSTTPTPTPTAAPSVTQEPEAPAIPGLEACGTVVPAPAETSPDLWVGDYGGGIDGDVMVPLDLGWSAITGEDWSGQSVAATVVGLWLVSEQDVVVAVPTTPPPASVPVTMTSGSEGGGSGSEGRIELSTQFAACPDGTGALPAATYRARIGVELSNGSSTESAWGDIPVFLPDYATATAG
ncbi:hypothetical protein [Actinotalea fermentans]|uniref:Uncharacterized protein n=1 Tax=Actinotalea fermentans TaxID=43671 RepID=A0A511YT50_9CELL|nr:hypothetical protein [Actinotalea fermentans]KGM17623.1 hypothetical protein N867_18400 [Actinotalea fermentans ATCC 43279 = JCM 9966 = DSM 3133]GEN78352.1 hypothetical protein AFE02nite_00860 [Actinotalea fermentans]